MRGRRVDPVYTLTLGALVVTVTGVTSLTSSISSFLRLKNFSMGFLFGKQQSNPPSTTSTIPVK